MEIRRPLPLYYETVDASKNFLLDISERLIPLAVLFNRISLMSESPGLPHSHYSRLSGHRVRLMKLGRVKKKVLVEYKRQERDTGTKRKQ